MLRKLPQIILSILIIFLSHHVLAADECSATLRISYPDGEKGCLSDLPFSKQINQSWNKPLVDVAQYATFYAIAVSDICEEVGFSSTTATDTKAFSQIESRAIANCQKGCECQLAVSNGRVLVPKSKIQLSDKKSLLEARRKEKELEERYAQTCISPLRINYADGEKGCLTDLPFTQQIAKGWNKPIFEVAQYATYYAIAASDICPEVGFGSTTIAPGRQNLQMGAESSAIDSCKKGCQCEILISNGNVTMTKAQTLLMGGASQHVTDKTSKEDIESLKKLLAERQALTEARRIEKERREKLLASCSLTLRLTYPNGENGCLTDLPLSKYVAKDWGKPIAEVAEYTNFYVVSASESCKDIGYASSKSLNPNTLPQLESIASASCAKGCNCATIIKNGKALLPKDLIMALGNTGDIQSTQLASLETQKLKRLEAEKLLADEAFRKEKERFDQIAKQQEAAQLALASKLREQNKLEEESKVKEQIKLAQETKRKEDERIAKEAAEKEKIRTAELQKAQDLVKSEQADRQKDRELMLQLSAELARLRAEAAAAKQTAVAPAVAVPVVVAAPTVSAPALQSPAIEQVFANRKALVIGNDGYKYVNGLQNAKEDAKSIADNLTKVGYKVTLKLDQTEKEMKASLRSFKSQVESGDEVAFFYAGHGVQVANNNYLIPIDVAGEGEEQIRDEAISLQRILDDMSDKKVKFTLAMVDACRDNPFKGNGRALAGAGTRGLAPTTAATGQMVVFSAGAGQQALDKLGPNDKDKNGLFTRVFIREMQKSGVSIDRVVRNVRNEVVVTAKSVGHDQVPAIYDQVVGEFYFKK